MAQKIWNKNKLIRNESYNLIFYSKASKSEIFKDFVQTLRHTCILEHKTKSIVY